MFTIFVHEIGGSTTLISIKLIPFLSLNFEILQFLLTYSQYSSASNNRKSNYGKHQIIHDTSFGSNQIHINKTDLSIDT